MADNNNKIKVVGYAKRVFYNDGIEYRNFSDDLVGNQKTESEDNSGSNSNFTLGNFITTTNFGGRLTRTYDTKEFSNFLTLDEIGVNKDTLVKVLDNNLKVSINVDNTNINNYAYFGSATEYVRVTLENIITLWPASLYVNPITVIDGSKVNGYTVFDYNYDLTLNKSTFKVNTNFVQNKFSINYQKNGSIGNTFNNGNDLRDFTANFTSYVILYEGNEYPIINYDAPINLKNDYMTFEVKGDVFKSIENDNKFIVEYHVKPKKQLEEEFFNSLNSFESNLLNRLVIPKYTSEYSFITESEDGTLISRKEKLTWPVSDGYNIDFNTNRYVEFVSKLVNITKNKDNLESNLMVRFLTSESISDFDTVPNCDGTLKETSGQKMNKTLKIYGREFDEIKKYIDGISFANVVTYDKKNNTPDQLVKYLARVLGWELTSSVLNDGLISSYLDDKTVKYEGQSRGLTAQEAEIELWRRLVLNSAWIWKSKGTRKAVEFFFKLIGAPYGLINFNEYVYNVKEPIDMDLFYSVLENNNLDQDLSLYNVDSQGYPKFFNNTSDMYFQKGGQWYRETSGTNATENLNTGNNPHIGPYDNGKEYIEQLNNIIPNFSAFTLTSTTISESNEQLFSNYNEGDINGYNGQIYVNVINDEGNFIDDKVNVESSIITDPCPTSKITDCGCDINEDDESIKLYINKNKTVCSDVNCDSIDIQYDSNYNVYEFKYLVKGGYGNNGNYFKNSYLGPKECCEKIYGNSYYYENLELDTFDSDNQIQLFKEGSKTEGYVCCLSEGVSNDLRIKGCGTFVSCQWQLFSSKFSDTIFISGEPNFRFLKFIDASGNERVVNELDSGFCHVYTTPKVVLDPYTNKIGYGCALPSNYDANNFMDIFNTYLDRAKNVVACDYNKRNI